MLRAFLRRHVADTCHCFWYNIFYMTFNYNILQHFPAFFIWHFKYNIFCNFILSSNFIFWFIFYQAWAMVHFPAYFSSDLNPYYRSSMPRASRYLGHNRGHKYPEHYRNILDALELVLREFVTPVMA